MCEEGSVTGEDFESGYTYLLGWVSIYLLALAVDILWGGK